MNSHPTPHLPQPLAEVAEEAGRDLWTVRFKGQEDRLDMLNPKLNEQQVVEVSQQLSDILNEEL